MPNPHTFKPPRDQRSMARQYHTGSQNTVPDPSASGPVTAREAFIAHRLGGLTTARMPGGGFQRRDTDEGGGLHAGSLNDRPERVGGYPAMSHADGQAFRNQFGDEFDQLHPDDQAQWQQQAEAMTAARGPGGPTAGNGPAPRSASAAPFPGANTPPPTPAPPHAKGALPGDSGTTDPNGDQHISTAGGGTVDIPARQSQDGPDNDPSFAPTNGTRTGIYGADGSEQVKQADGKFVPARGPGLAATAGPAAPANPLLAAAQSPDTAGHPDALTASMMGGAAPFPGSSAPAASTAAAPSAPPAPIPPAGPLSGGMLGATAGPGRGSAYPGGKLLMSNPVDEEDEEQGSAHAFPGRGRNAAMA